MALDTKQHVRLEALNNNTNRTAEEESERATLDNFLNDPTRPVGSVVVPAISVAQGLGQPVTTVRPGVEPLTEPVVTSAEQEENLRVKTEALNAAKAANPQDKAAIAAAQVEVDAAQKAIDESTLAPVVPEPVVFPDGTPKV